MSLRAYQQASARAESPREMEYRLFGQVTRALMEASMLPDTEIAKRMDALDWTDRLQHHNLRFARRRSVVVDAGGERGS